MSESQAFITISPDAQIVIAIGHRGIHFLDPTTWALIFQCKLGDIENCNIQPISRVEFRGAPTSARMLHLNVNGLEINILTSDAYDFRNLLTACASESLGRGSFPHGTEGGDDILESHFNRVNRADDPLVLLEYFEAAFPFLPKPPLPPKLGLAPQYFDPPRSQRQV